MNREHLSTLYPLLFNKLLWYLSTRGNLRQEMFQLTNTGSLTGPTTIASNRFSRLSYHIILLLANYFAQTSFINKRITEKIYEARMWWSEVLISLVQFEGLSCNHIIGPFFCCFFFSFFAQGNLDIISQTLVYFYSFYKRY